MRVAHTVEGGVYEAEEDRDSDGGVCYEHVDQTFRLLEVELRRLSRELEDLSNEVGEEACVHPDEDELVARVVEDSRQAFTVRHVDVGSDPEVDVIVLFDYGYLWHLSLGPAPVDVLQLIQVPDYHIIFLTFGDDAVVKPQLLHGAVRVRIHDAIGCPAHQLGYVR